MDMQKRYSRRQFLLVTTGSVLSASVAGKLSAKSGTSKHPNLVFVFPDQMRGQALGFLNEDPVITPNLDAPYKPYVDCANNRERMAWNEWRPPQRRHGFDFWYAYGTYDYHLKPMYWSGDSQRDKFQYVNQWGPEHEADLALKYIKNEGGKYRNSNQPFALVVSMNPPHMLYQMVPQKYLEHYRDKSPEDLINRPNVNLKGNSRGAKLAQKQIKNYFAMVTGVDDQFGRILKTLKETGLDDNTIVVFTSDHGNCLGCHDVPTKNVHYEESMRIPFLIRWPRKIKPRRDDLLLSTMDIHPTLLDLMGFADTIPKAVQGASHARVFLTGKGPRPDSQWYMWTPYDNPGGGRRGVRTHRYTLMINKMPGKPVKTVLHDNIHDPYQLKNIAEEKPKVVQGLTREMESWLKKFHDPWLNS
jgi:arylsulfatase A-like enzyme